MICSPEFGEVGLIVPLAARPSERLYYHERRPCRNPLGYRGLGSAEAEREELPGSTPRPPASSDEKPRDRQARQADQR